MMYKTLVRPILEYAAQILSYQHYYYQSGKKGKAEKKATDDQTVKLEAFQNKVLKKLVPCPKSTPPAILRILTGTMSIAAKIDILKPHFEPVLAQNTVLRPK